MLGKSSPPPLRPQPRPVFEPLPDLALEAALDRLVERSPAQRVRPVVLAREGVGRVVVVLVVGPVAFALHQPRRRVEDGLGRRQRTLGFGERLRGGEGCIDGVRLRRGRDIDDGLGDRQFALRAAEEVVGVLGRASHDEGLRIGEPDVLGGHAHDAASDEQGVLAGLEHPGEIVERRVGVRAAHAFVQRRDQVVVAVLRLVVEGRAPLHDVDQPMRVQDLAGPCGAPDLLGQRQHGAAVAVGHADQRGARFRIERQGLAEKALGPPEQSLERFRRQRAEHQHARAG